ncbi:MAG: hypothetical protein IJ007_06960 [Oscillospiraceae bacterium]|nr:hypothetical protein [Oscillospiraceae bacterium]
MDKLIMLLEGIVSDIAFSGTNEIRSDILERIIYARKLCGELGMKNGEVLCARLEECASENAPEKTAAVLCRLCCYMECISGQSA